jgi:hypothetical protein
MAATDPCALLPIQSMRDACIRASTGGVAGAVGGVLGSGTGITGDIRKLMMRVGEVGVGLLLVVIAANALLKQSGTAKVIIQGSKKVAGK